MFGINWTFKQKFRALMVPVMILGAVLLFQNDMAELAVACVFLAGMYTSAFLRHLGDALGVDMKDPA